jgi:hypothetical protein
MERQLMEERRQAAELLRIAAEEQRQAAGQLRMAAEEERHTTAELHEAIKLLVELLRKQ